MGKRILVVDDSPTIRYQVSLVLREAGFDTVEATDGIEGLATLARTSGTAMIICDVNMPRMDGLEMVETLRKTGNQVPIVMLTTEGQPSLVKRAQNAGAKGWIVKPFRTEILLAAVKKVIGDP